MALRDVEHNTAKHRIEHYVDHSALDMEIEASGPFVEKSLQLGNGPAIVVLHIDWTVFQQGLTYGPASFMRLSFLAS